VAIEKINVEQFLQQRQLHLVIDVRSPAEYAHAHIPGAINIPLFTNDERTVVGTAYKQQSKEKAIKLGLQFFGPKMVAIIEEVEQIIANTKNEKNNETPTLIVHCWRGGMRSAGIAWLLNLYGYKVHTIIGGYKAYRGWVHNQFKIKYNLSILGGYTGSAKTVLLKQLEAQKQLTICLEGLANHKGSAFGKIGMPPQPSQEMFENLLAENLAKINSEHSSTIWLEDESQRIGAVMLPIDIWNQMRESNIYFLNIPFEERLNYLVQDYPVIDIKEFSDAVTRITKRLGGLETKNTLTHLENGNIKEAFSILLQYYDKWYLKGLYAREHIKTQLHTLDFDNVLGNNQANKIIELQYLQSNKDK
jgi:tRNA 2-selenouridine synthase